MYGDFSLIVQEVWVGNLYIFLYILQRICPRSSCFQTDLITGCIQRDVSKEQYSTITGSLQFNKHWTLKSFHHLKMYFIISWIFNVWNHGNPRVPAPMPPPQEEKKPMIVKGIKEFLNQRCEPLRRCLWIGNGGGREDFALRTRGRLWWSVWYQRGLCLDTRWWLKNDFCSECFTPNAPCMDYLPTSGEKMGTFKGKCR